MKRIVDAMYVFFIIAFLAGCGASNGEETLQYFVDSGRLPEGIKKQIETSGKADVIIEVDSSEAREKARQMREAKGLIYDDAEIIAEKARLYNIEKSQVLTQIPTSDYAILEHYNNSPIMFIEVNENALMILLQSPDVTRIGENQVSTLTGLPLSENPENP